MSVYPTVLDTLSSSRGTASDTLSAVPHVTHHLNEDTAIEALEAKVGVNGSAVTTSHDYKLSGVTGTDKAVSKTGTETLTNKTLTSPVINVTSDATGDLYYRNSGGALARLPIGTAGQILDVSAGGIPEWIANPSASDATTAVKGVVELATDAEMNAGTATGGTGANLAIAASSAGAVAANKLVQFTSATKYPAADGSLITNIAGSSITDFNGTVNALETSNTWYTWTQPFISVTLSGPTETIVGFNNNFTVGNSTKGGFGFKDLSASASCVLYDKIPGNTGTNTAYTAATSKDIKFKWRMVQGVNGSGDYLGFGIADATTTFDDVETSVAAGIRFVNNNGVIFASNGNGASNTNTNVDSGITDANWNTYEIIFNPGVNAKFYINGTLVATHTTNLPTGSLQYFGIGYTKGTNNLTFYVNPVTISLEM